MALKFLKGSPLSSATTSSAEKIPHPLATNVRTQNLPPPVSSTHTGLTNTGLRGVKRARDSSWDENSTDEDISDWRVRDTTAGPTERRKFKRVRTGDHQWMAYHSYKTKQESSSDEYEEEEEETMTPSPVKSESRTGLNIEGLSLTPPDHISSEYASMNGLLKTLHLNRGLGDSREERSKPGLKELEGRKLQPLRPLATATPEKVPPASQQPDDREVNNKKIDEQKEKDSVTSIYEEANRALGRLMLDRRKLARPTNMSEVEDSEEEEDESEEDEY